MKWSATSRLCLTTLLAAASMGQAAASEAATQAAAPDLKDPAAARRLVSELGDAGPAVRDQAQKQLDALPLWTLPDLEKLADNARDAEAKARLISRCRSMQDEILRLTDPPGITLQVEKATLGEVARALGEKVNAPLTGNGPGWYSIQAVNQPFWEVFNQIYDQRPVWFADRGYREERRPGEIPGKMLQGPILHGISNRFVHRGFMVCIGDDLSAMENQMDQRRAAEMHLAPPPRREIFNMYLCADPRIHIAQAATPQITQATENFGKAWKTYADMQSDIADPVDAVVRSRVVEIDPPADAGEWVSIRGQWPVAISLEEATGEVDDLEHPEKSPVKLGDCTVVVKSVVVKQSQLTISVNVSPSMRNLPDSDLPGPRPLTVTVLASDGQILEDFAVMTTHGPEGLTDSVADGAKPAKLILSMPTKTVDYAVPFEFKGLHVRAGNRPFAEFGVAASRPRIVPAWSQSRPS